MTSNSVPRPSGMPATRRNGRFFAKIVISAVVLALIAIYGISAVVGWQLTHPARRAIDTSPADVGLRYQDIVFKSRYDAINLKGWLLKAQENRNTVIFAHGYGRNRLQDDVPLLPIANAFVKQGMNVVMFDFRNSGESEGALTTVGMNEVSDLLGAVDFVQSRPELSQTITLFGFSMGAATAIVAGGLTPAVAAVIADSPFADLHSYLLENLSVWSNLPKIPFNYTILSVIPALTGLRTETFIPLAGVKKLDGRPLLLIHGEADRDIPIENSEVLKAVYPYSQLVRFPGAGHVRSYAIAREQYINLVTKFLITVNLSVEDKEKSR